MAVVVLRLIELRTWNSSKHQLLKENDACWIRRVASTRMKWKINLILKRLYLSRGRSRKLQALQMASHWTHPSRDEKGLQAHPRSPCSALRNETRTENEKATWTSLSLDQKPLPTNSLFNHSQSSCYCLSIRILLISPLHLQSTSLFFLNDPIKSSWTFSQIQKHLLPLRMRINKPYVL